MQLYVSVLDYKRHIRDPLLGSYSSAEAMLPKVEAFAAFTLAFRSIALAVSSLLAIGSLSKDGSVAQEGAAKNLGMGRARALAQLSPEGVDNRSRLTRASQVTMQRQDASNAPVCRRRSRRPHVQLEVWREDNSLPLTARRGVGRVAERRVGAHEPEPRALRCR
jgi:hypothetical protein